MQLLGYFLDTNLPVLLVVGRVDRRCISRHKRTRSYTVDDYDKLCHMLGKVKRILVTSNILTETSNLLCNDKRMVMALRNFILSPYVEGVCIGSRVAVNSTAFERLGLTDCGLLEVIKCETPLLTTDFVLARVAHMLDPSIAILFRRSIR